MRASSHTVERSICTDVGGDVDTVVTANTVVLNYNVAPGDKPTVKPEADFTIRIEYRDPIKPGKKVFSGRLLSNRMRTTPLNVAVKIIPHEDIDKQIREPTNLLALQYHPNVVKYIHCCEGFYLSGEVLCIVMEKCSSRNLHDRVLSALEELECDEYCKTVILHIAHGMNHIHKNDITHRDLKPHNILFSKDGRTVLIGDFGFSKKMKIGLDATSLSSNRGGTDGWRAPETYENCNDLVSTETPDANSKLQITNKVDTFSFGLIVYFLLSGGNHAFGKKPLAWASNIKEYEGLDLSELKCPDDQIAKHLIEWMLAKKPNDRPSVDDVLRHPFFWDPDQKLQFYEKAFGKLIGPDEEEITVAPKQWLSKCTEIAQVCESQIMQREQPSASTTVQRQQAGSGDKIHQPDESSNIHGASERIPAVERSAPSPVDEIIPGSPPESPYSTEQFQNALTSAKEQIDRGLHMEEGVDSKQFAYELLESCVNLFHLANSTNESPQYTSIVLQDKHRRALLKQADNFNSMEWLCMCTRAYCSQYKVHALQPNNTPKVPAERKGKTTADKSGGEKGLEVEEPTKRKNNMSSAEWSKWLQQCNAIRNQFDEAIKMQGGENDSLREDMRKNLIAELNKLRLKRIQSKPVGKKHQEWENWLISCVKIYHDLCALSMDDTQKGSMKENCVELINTTDMEPKVWVKKCAEIIKDFALLIEESTQYHGACSTIDESAGDLLRGLRDKLQQLIGDDAGYVLITKSWKECVKKADDMAQRKENISQAAFCIKCARCNNDTIFTLLRFIRNAYVHFDENMQIYGSRWWKNKDEMWHFLSDTFPELFPHVYNVMRNEMHRFIEMNKKDDSSHRLPASDNRQYASDEDDDTEDEYARHMANDHDNTTAVCSTQPLPLPPSICSDEDGYQRSKGITSTSTQTDTNSNLQEHMPGMPEDNEVSLSSQDDTSSDSDTDAEGGDQTKAGSSNPPVPIRRRSSILAFFGKRSSKSTSDASSTKNKSSATAGCSKDSTCDTSSGSKKQGAIRKLFPRKK